MKKISSLSAILLFLGLSVFSINIAAQTLEGKQNDLMNQLLGDSVEGVWNLNIYESDDPVRKIQSLIQRALASPEREESAEQTVIPRVSISIFPPERLVVERGGNEMTINEFYPNEISTRTMKTDGQTHMYPAGNNFYIAVNVSREGQKMLVETHSPSGNQMVETFELSADGSKLKVTVQISDSNVRELLSLQRIYDRPISDDLSGYN